MFSVIVPSYNRAHSIVATLDSVESQTYRPIEIIVVDDGSSDETCKVVEAWLKRHNDDGGLTGRLISQANSGAAVARNRGLSEANGNYIQFLDSDDLMHAKRLEILAKTFQEQNADFIQTSIEWFDPATNETLRTLWARPHESQIELVLNGQFWANTLRGALTKELADRIGPWEEQMTCFQDREYMERAVMRARNPIAVKPVLGYLDRGAGEHVSSKHRTHEGRKWRIFCEGKLVEEVLRRKDVTAVMRSVLADRIYRVGCRSAARGWPAYAKECADIADSLQARNTVTTQVKRLLCRLGSLGGPLYRLMDTIKFALKRHERPQY